MFFKGTFKIIILTCFITACNTKHEVSNLKTIAEKRIVVDPIKPKLLVDSIVKVPNIEGRFDLVTGYGIYADSTKEFVYKATLYMERLSPTDFGYYMTKKIKGIRPLGEYGIYRYYKNGFYDLGICIEETRGIYLQFKRDVKIKNNYLSIINNASNSNDYFIYKKEVANAEIYISLRKTLKETKKDYLRFVETYHSVKKIDTSKLEITHHFKGNAWQTEHYHKEFKESFYVTHTDGNKINKMRDSIFYLELKKITN